MVFVACSDDTTDNPYDKESSISLVSSSVLFEAVGDTGSIYVQAANGITAVESEHADWCKVSAEGNKVAVSVDNNQSVSGRASLVKIYSGSDYVTATVQQQGAVFKFEVPSNLSLEDKASSVTYALSSSFPVTFSASDWITVTQEDKSVKFDFAANETGHIRSGMITYTVNGDTDTITVAQHEFSDIEGVYALVDGYYSTSDSIIYTIAQLTEVSGKKVLNFPSMDLTLPVTIDEDTYSVVVNAGSYMGTYGQYYMFTTLWDINQGYLTSSSDVSYQAPMQYYSDYDMTIGYFEDNGSWSGYEIGALRFEAYKSDTLANKNRAGALDYYIYPYLMSVSTSGAKPFRASAGKKAFAKDVKLKYDAQALPKKIPFYLKRK